MLKIMVKGYALETKHEADLDKGPEIIWKEFSWPTVPRKGEQIDVGTTGLDVWWEEVNEVIHCFKERIIEVHFSATREDLKSYVEDHGFQIE